LRLNRQIFVAAMALSLWLGRPSTSIAAPESQFFDAKGVKIHFLIEGTGEPVVLIHGLDSSARINWQMPGTIDALARDHQVIAVDLPGYGESDKPADPAAYGEQWVDDVILLLDRLNIRKAHIVGYSMGGMVALKLIAEHPERVISGTLGGAGWLRADSILQKIWAHMRSPGARSISELALTADQLKAIRTPVEILVGDRDPMKKLYVEPLESVRSDWRVIEIEGAGHLSCIVKKQFIDELEKWLDMNRQK
jgi:pimeloyl-ACP methyl ester carboxylesterase